MSAIKEFMNTEIQSAETDATLEELAKLMAEHDTGFLPILKNEKYAGVVTDRDIVVKGLAKGSIDQLRAEDIINETVITANADMDGEEASLLMQDHQIKRLLVVEHDKVQGVVSLGDIAADENPAIAGGAQQEIKKGDATN
ncbi:CBS domain-containing protein [Alkalicoccus luteus]|uniref:CBS domain-containing protein n=1 Tax=Alkalicoccus luteus TaxID=1237094 RepID=UPI0040341FCF